MPLKFFTSFNGAADMRSLPLERLFGSYIIGNNSGITYSSSDNFVTRTFGFGMMPSGNGGGFGYFKVYHRGNSTTSGTSAQVMTVSRSTADPSSNCLLYQYVRPAGDSIAKAGGVNLMTSGDDGNGRFGHFIYGMRIRWPSEVANFYTTPIEVYATNNGNGSSLLYSLSSAFGAAFAGKERYLEVEIDTSAGAATAPFKVWLDDEIVASGSTTAGSWFGLYVGCGTTTPVSGSTPVRILEYRDMYVMEVNDPTVDLRMGSATTVVALPTTTDSSVQFQRPESYSSNASVVQGELTTNSGANRGNLPVPVDSDRVLVADDVGQRDLYGIDIAKASAVLGSIDAVSVRTHAFSPTLGRRTFNAIGQTGAAMTEGADTNTTIDQQYQASFLRMPSDPQDGKRWTLTKLAGLKVGTLFKS